MGALRINVSHDVWKLRDELSAFARTQMPFATARALTEVARRAKDDVGASIVSKFDRPTTFTRNAAGFTPARKQALRSVVFIKDIQANYLRLQETGGTRVPLKTALILPVDIGLNNYGNIPKGMLKRLKGNADVFAANINGVGGIWQRGPMHSIRLLVAFKPKAEYKPRFGYHQTVARRVQRDLPVLLRLSLAQALKTAAKR